jgi:hypothetical protein
LFLGSLDEPAARDFSSRLVNWIDSGQLSLKSHRYWNSPLLGWEMPSVIHDDLGQAAIVISKGDANFRRLLGDLRWPETTPFTEITEYFPTRLAALRVDKSELAVNLHPAQLEELDIREKNWRYNGRWGMVQFNPMSA